MNSSLNNLSIDVIETNTSEINIGVSQSVLELQQINTNLMSDQSYFKLQFGDINTMADVRTYTNYGQIFGLNVADGNAPVWTGGAPKIFMTGEASLTITSDNVADTFGTGAGAWTVIIEGLNSNFDDVVEQINLNGVTPVITIAPFYRVNRVFCLAAPGGAESNVGTITLIGQGNLQAIISPGDGINHSTYRSYKYPAGILDLLLNTSKTGGGGSPVVLYTLWVRMAPDLAGGLVSTLRVWDLKIDSAVDGWVRMHDKIGDHILGKTDVWITASTTVNDTDTAVKMVTFEGKNIPPFRPSLG